MMNRGLLMVDLFDSAVFNYAFDFDEWPTTSPYIDDHMKLMPYNGSMFKLRYEYKNIFEPIYLKEEANKKKQEEKDIESAKKGKKTLIKDQQAE